MGDVTNIHGRPVGPAAPHLRVIESSEEERAQFMRRYAQPGAPIYRRRPDRDPEPPQAA